MSNVGSVHCFCYLGFPRLLESVLFHQVRSFAVCPNKPKIQKFCKTWSIVPYISRMHVSQRITSCWREGSERKEILAIIRKVAFGYNAFLQYRQWFFGGESMIITVGSGRSRPTVLFLTRSTDPDFNIEHGLLFVRPLLTNFIYA